MTSVKNHWSESIICLQMRLFMCINVSTSCKVALSMSSFLEIHLQKGSVLCISLSVSFQSSVRGGGALTLSVVNVHSTLHITKKKYAEFLLHYRWLFVKGNVFVGEWGIFGAEVFLHYSQFFIKDDFVIGGVECSCRICR